jgi:hypothetical protein
MSCSNSDQTIKLAIKSICSCPREARQGHQQETSKINFKIGAADALNIWRNNWPISKFGLLMVLICRSFLNSIPPERVFSTLGNEKSEWSAHDVRQSLSHSFVTTK